MKTVFCKLFLLQILRWAWPARVYLFYDSELQSSSLSKQNSRDKEAIEMQKEESLCKKQDLVYLLVVVVERRQCSESHRHRREREGPGEVLPERFHHFGKDLLGTPGRSRAVSTRQATAEIQ